MPDNIDKYLPESPLVGMPGVPTAEDLRRMIDEDEN
jgi:hypothetical protein